MTNLPNELNDLRVFVFPGSTKGAGVPTLGPFALKLEAWLRLTGIPYQRVIEGNPAKGPKKKSPWIEYGSVRLGDTAIIIHHLEEKTGRSLDSWLSPEQAALSLVLQRMLSEDFHQTFEYEMMMRDAGWKFITPGMNHIPQPLRWFVAASMRRHFRKQLYARGLGRHNDDEIIAIGRAAVDALAVLLGEKPWLFGDRPCTADASLYGMLAPLIFLPVETPVAQHLRSKVNLVNYCERIRGQLFP
jgi:glutathione S-transferase